ncbi:peroxiredoxin [Limnoglobus roseus]|uniref:thioredoxin-dependent peroxiredoxin n=1 Tax=Limnoglobus roseus TaxID=2598579 RepID=A0A5C1A795_9BACT|nr:peroxiredoxin [Limnoglobus roseus]QEL13712.1 peroxiredoxin [Limnoglobus roseus]
MSRWFLALAVSALALGSLSADDSTLKVKVGDPFPDVPLEATQIDKVKKDAKTVSVKDLKGKVVVVFFYPKAKTPGCTVESCGFRDVAKDFPADVVVLGASADGTKLNGEFTTEQMLPYPLLCDTDLKLIKELGIQNPKGKTAQRLTFVVGKDGKIAKIYEKVTPKDHPKEVLAFVKELDAKK